LTKKKLPTGLAGHGKESGRCSTRSELAVWLTSEANPLSARVWVNLLWQQHFGRGLVATPADFGTHGAEPTHPELLDWLSAELRENGWSTKHLHRLIVTSNTYRQAALPCDANERIDPENLYFWRWTPRRLESEAIRDCALAVSGELDSARGGPSDASETNSVRRSLYLRQHRFHLPSTQALFDAPISNESCPRRHVSTVPLQSLHLLNNPQMLKRAEALATRVRAKGGPNWPSQLDVAFELALGRTPDQTERSFAEKFFQSHRSSTQAESSEAAENRALIHLCHALLNLNEFVYIP
jgi:hypothetical protein